MDHRFKAEADRITVDPGDSHNFRIKSYVGEGKLKVLDEEGCIHEKENAVMQGSRVKYELVDKI